jgi:N-methylhydantoinase B
MPKPFVDPITLEVIRNRLRAIPEQIETNIVRTAYSTLIYEYKDFAVGLVDHEGKLISQGRGGIPLFVANILGAAVSDGISLYSAEGFEHGDLVLCNYSGVLGQHLNNVVMYTPVFANAADKRPCAFVAIVVHWADVGGREVGSSSVNDTVSIFQEGIQFRTVKLYKAGQPVADMYRMIEFNTRFPKEVLGDVESQVAGCLLGRELYLETITRYGRDTVRTAIELIWSQSEQAARRVVAALPDGEYRAAAFLDDDGLPGSSEVQIPVTVRVEGDSLTVDLSDIASVLRGPFNSGPKGGGETAARIAFNYLVDSDDGPNDGMYRPLSVILPPGKFLSAPPTAPMARYSTPLPTVIDVILRAIGEAAPQRLAAGHHGNFGVHMFTGRNPAGELFKNMETVVGGYGATKAKDGSGPFKTYSHGDTQNVPVELQEALYPILIERLSLRTDSGGPGQRRGGLGVLKTCRVLAPCRLNTGFERAKCPPWGVHGGLDGETGKLVLERPGEEPKVLLKATVDLFPGDVVHVYSGGGGGFGSPLQRERVLVLEDVHRGYVSPAAAERIYGLSTSPCSGKALVSRLAETTAAEVVPMARKVEENSQ